MIHIKSLFLLVILLAAMLMTSHAKSVSNAEGFGLAVVSTGGVAFLSWLAMPIAASHYLLGWILYGGWVASLYIGIVAIWKQDVNKDYIPPLLKEHRVLRSLYALFTYMVILQGLWAAIVLAVGTQKL